VSASWRKAYSELKEYIARNPKIAIGQSIVAIPRDVRPEFYRLFDTVRTAFLKEKFQTLLDEAIPLSKDYAEVGQEVTKSLGLSDIKVSAKVSASLNWFLNDPVNGLNRSFFDPLFNLLKGRLDINSFEQEASICIENSFSRLFQSGYKMWVALSLINLLAPDRALVVYNPNEDIVKVEKDAPGMQEEPVPSPEEAKSLSLGHAMEAALFIVPDLIVHSAKLGRYVSIRSDLTDAIWRARRVSSNKEWYRFPELMGEYTKVAHWADLFIYIDDKPEELALVADFDRFCRPDIIVKCMEQADWYQKGGLERVKRNHDVLKPRLGSYVVSRLPVPEEAFRELVPEPVTVEPPAGGAAPVEPEAEQVSGETVSEQAPQEPEKQPLDIHILTIGYDRSQLAPIIETLLPPEEATKEAEGQ
jgi:hypothetical protein